MSKSAAAKVDEAFGPDHWIAAVARSAEGGVLAAMGRHAEAEPMLKQGYEALRDNPSARPAYLRRARESLAAFYEASGRKDLALTYREEAPPAAPGS